MRAQRDDSVSYVGESITKKKEVAEILLWLLNRFSTGSETNSRNGRDAFGYENIETE